MFLLMIKLKMYKQTICIIGRKRVGKDTAADYICSRLGCKKYALATPLKELICNIFGLTMNQLDMFKNESWNFEASNDSEAVVLHTNFRKILQKTGDELKGFFGLDCFLQKVHLELLEDSNKHAVISDVRLKEEQVRITTHLNPIWIKIERDIEKDDDSMHRTESEVDTLGYDILIKNDGDILALNKKLDIVINNLNKNDI